MPPSRLSHWLRVSVLLGLCSFMAYACGGSQFSSTGGSSGSGAVGGGSAGSTASGGSSSGGGPAKACQGPEDCDDGDPCTVDQCGADGTCKRAAKCGPTEKCCDGACGQCCAKADCDDGVACTDDDCFAGGCTHAPNDTTCGMDQYCSVLNGCRHKEACTVSADCDDKDPCTTDTCTNALCEHPATDCGSGSLCCPGSGCAQCCEDSQCDDKNPCTKDQCVSGMCQHPTLCADSKCCPSSDQSSATCGACCSAAGCDDGVSCTKDSCTQGTCGHAADSSTCQAGFSCDPVKGCLQTAQCLTDGDCTSTDPCQTGSCVNGSCAFSGCQSGKCCSTGCETCCADTDCDDGIACTVDSCSSAGTCSHTPNNGACNGLTCDPANGGCIECTSDAQCDDKSDCTSDSCDLSTHKCAHSAVVCSAKGLLCCGATCAACCSDLDCQGGVTTQSASPIGGKCSVPACISGVCSTKTVTCPVGGLCCVTGCCGVAQPD